jgi:hypothetical protein
MAIAIDKLLPSAPRRVPGVPHVGHLTRDGRAGARARPQRPSAATLRRRRLATVLATLCVLAACAIAARSTPSTSAAPVPAAPPPATVVIAPGDTLWDLAAAHAPPQVDVASYAAAVAAHNGLDARRLQPGDAVELP